MKKPIGKSYFTWISNFGVVPLFLSAFFLLMPALLLLLFLFDFVTLVLDTICNLLKIDIHACGIKYLPLRTQTVKALMFSTVIIITTITHSTAFGKTNSYENIIISKGEHREFKIKSLVKFSVGNNEIISQKFYPKKGTMLIKGKKMGYTELVVWHAKNKTKRFRIYVLSKIAQMKILHLAETLKAMNLSVDISGTMIQAKGVIDSMDDLRLIKKLIKNNNKNLHLKVTLHDDLRNLIIGVVYKEFFDEYIESISCKSDAIEIICQYDKDYSPPPEIKNYLKKNYLVSFIPVSSKSKKKNFLVKLKLIQMEKLDGEEFSLGLSQLSGNLGELFQNGIKSVLEKNSFILSNRNIHLSTLAEPETLLRPGKETLIEVGAQIPYQLSGNSEQVPHINWKFAGLRVVLTLQRQNRDYVIKFQTEFSRPAPNGGISGNKENSWAILRAGHPLQLFQIGLKTEGKSTYSFPWLSKIPILGNIFKSKSSQSNYKRITGVIILEEHES
ncbi:MAG: hypothetical protein KAQ98_04095 [Bacteriovoracaceae bacterium]|nr:hypothetical protein [Bacteriovoracaceae bacterium]